MKDKFINNVRAEAARRFDLKTDGEIDAFFKGMGECAKDNQEALEKRDKMLRDTVKELCEAKRLLKAAVEDMHNSVNDAHCKYCSKWHTDQCQSTSHLDCYIENKFEWRYANKALALIGKDGDNVE